MPFARNKGAVHCFNSYVVKLFFYCKDNIIISQLSGPQALKLVQNNKKSGGLSLKQPPDFKFSVY